MRSCLHGFCTFNTIYIFYGLRPANKCLAAYIGLRLQVLSLQGGQAEIATRERVRCFAGGWRHAICQGICVPRSPPSTATSGPATQVFIFSSLDERTASDTIAQMC